MKAFHTQDVLDSEGRKFRIEHHYDTEYPNYPWESLYDFAHGPVSDWTKRAKRPGEWVLSADKHGYKRYYDFAQAMKIARADDWESIRHSYPAKLRGKQYEAAVTLDYERMRDWCNDKWHYMGITVTPLTEDGDELRSKEQGTWGIESDSDPAWIQEIEENLLRDVGAELSAQTV